MWCKEHKKIFENWILTVEFHDYPQGLVKLFSEAEYTGANVVSSSNNQGKNLRHSQRRIVRHPHGFLCDAERQP